MALNELVKSNIEENFEEIQFLMEVAPKLLFRLIIKEYKLVNIQLAETSLNKLINQLKNDKYFYKQQRKLISQFNGCQHYFKYPIAISICSFFSITSGQYVAKIDLFKFIVFILLCNILIN